MAKGIYLGVDAVSRKNKNLLKGVNGVSRSITQGYFGVKSVSRQFYAKGTPLREFAEGSIIKIKENGSWVEFYVAKHNYESGLNGSGRTLVVRKDCYDTRAWHSSNVNAYASSSIDSWLNGTYKGLLDADIQSVIGTTKFYYTPGNENTTVTTLSRSIFLLSVTELGKTASYAKVEGMVLPIAGTLQVAYCNGSKVSQWTRSPSTSSTDGVCYLNASGKVYNYFCTNARGSRPAFTLPSEILISDDMTVV